MAKAKVTAEETADKETKTTPAVTETDTAADISTKDNKSGGDTHIYVGADIPGVMKSNTTFTGKIPEKLNVPFVCELIIPVEDFTAFLKKKAVTESREAFCYRKSAEYAETLRK